VKRLALCLALVPVLALASAPSPETAAATLWRALSHGPNAGADVAALGKLFHGEAMIYGGRYKDGAPAFSATRAADFVASLAAPRAYAFYECEVKREVKRYDRFATVYSVVESRRDPKAAAADFAGVNSIQLYQDGAEWKIVSLYYHVEKPGAAISLEGGKPGACLAQ
jgi:hypothetical protein